MSTDVLFFLFVISLIAIFVVYKGFLKWRHTKAMSLAFPPAWRDFLSDKLAVYDKLPHGLKDDLEGHIKHFLYCKKFVGCGGLIITDEIRVTIAAEACLLLINRPSSRYEKLRWIYVYPSTFIAKRDDQNAYGVVTKGKSHLLGESWSSGKVILAWDSVERGMADFNDGQNVVLHEFAHQLDQEGGAANGAPLLYTKDSYRIWSQVFGLEFQRLQESHAKGKKTLIDQYGATNAAEFFAVVTELFFERPVAMNRRHPELFMAMKDYYRTDPREWV